MASFKFELVSPERLVLSGDVDQVDLPGTDGDLGVMAGHAPFLTTLRPGVVTVRTGGQSNRIFVRGGFADVNGSGLTILAETAIPVSELKADQVAAEVKNAEEDLRDAKSAEAKAAAEARLETARQLQAAL